MAGQIPLVLIEISHADITTVRVVNSYSNVISNGYEYVGYPFSLILPDKDERATVTIDNVDRAIIDEIRTLSGEADFKISVVLESDPDVIESGPYELKFQKADWDERTIVGTIGDDNFAVEPYPGEDINPTDFPGVYSGV